MKTFLAGLLLFLIPVAQAEQESTPDVNAKILKYGLYAVTLNNGKSWVNPITDDELSSPYPEPIHIKTTKTVPAITPLFFGFEYNLDGLPDGIALITTSVKHPPIKNEEGKVTTEYQEQHKYLALDGKLTSLTGYILENNNELTPGDWHFSINYEGKELLTHKFTVVQK